MLDKSARKPRREISRRVKLSVFAFVVAMCFAVGSGLGEIVGPINVGVRHGGH
jgi:hypothetical protein